MLLISLQDLISQDIVDLYNAQNVDLLAIVVNIIIVFLLSLIILAVYKKAYQTTVYNRSFAISLPITAMVTSVIIISVASNIILSLGMVGALSIVRFRTALKNPFDTVFMFWSVGLGITVGAGLILVAALSTVAIAIAILLLIYMEIFVDSYFLIIRSDNKDTEEQILNEVNDIYKRYTLKNKTIRNNKLDLTLEVRSRKEKEKIKFTEQVKRFFTVTLKNVFKRKQKVKKNDSLNRKTLLVNRIADIDNVTSVVILSHNGDYISE